MNDIESKLKLLQPNDGVLNRDQLLYSAAFAAGKASASKFPWRWVCGLLLCMQIGLIAWVVRNPSVKVDPVVIQVNVEPTIPSEPIAPVSPEPTSYIALMQHLGEDTVSTSYPEPSLPQTPLTPHSRID